MFITDFFSELNEDNSEFVVFVNGKSVSKSRDRFEAEKDLQFLRSKGYDAELKKLQCAYVSLNESKTNEFVQNYLPLLQKELGLKELPKIKLLDMPEDTTFGKYGGGTLYVVTGGRHPVDVLRTLAHELTHFKQDGKGELTDGAGETGTPQENEANSNAGIIMRNFAKNHPEEFGLDEQLHEEIGPGVGQELELMMAGKKPAALVNDIAKWQSAIAGTGQVLHNMFSPIIKKLGMNEESANQQIRFADGYVVFSNHFKERLRQRNISVESILRLLNRVESRREEDLINMPFVNFVIKSNDLGISLKKEKNGDRTVYVASTVHPDLNVGDDEDVIYLEDEEFTETIRKVKGGYKVLSKKGKNLGGPYKSKSQAQKRLGQVEYFKHMKEDDNWGKMSSNSPKDTSAIKDLKKDLKEPYSYDAIDHMMTTIAKKHNMTPHDLHLLFVDKVGTTPDVWIRKTGGSKPDKWSSKKVNEFAPPKDDGNSDSDDAINHLKAMAASWCKNPNPRIERELRDLGYHINMLKSQNGVILYPLDKSYDTIKFSKDDLFPKNVNESIKNRPPSLRKVAGVKEGESINHTHLLRLRGRINTMKSSKNKNTRNRGIQLERQVQTFKNFHPIKNPAVGAQVMESENTTSPAQTWVKKVYDMYPDWPYGQADKVMVWGEGQDQQFAAFKLKPLNSKVPTVDIEWIMTGPEHRQGVGSRAMKELQRLAQEDGIRLTLYPWDKGQVKQRDLIRFYKNQGFNPQVKGSKQMHWQPDTK